VLGAGLTGHSLASDGVSIGSDDAYPLLTSSTRLTFRQGYRDFGQLFAAATSTSLSFSAQDEPAAAAAGGQADAAAEMARKLQDPLANISALMTENVILLNTNGGTSFNFQLQPVQAFDFPDQGFSFIARGVIPILGFEPGGQAPILGNPTEPGGSRVWGLGDSILQTFFAPKSDAAWKWGIGPQISFPTATDSRLTGPGWGGGVSAVVVGGLTDELSLAVIGGHLWGSQSGYSTTLIQPALFYNPPQLPGLAIGYNAGITYDWSTNSNNALTLPLGAMVGQTLDIGDGFGLDLNIGAYYNAVRPDGAGDWQIKFGISLLFP
jgi:hypothetical protein